MLSIVGSGAMGCLWAAHLYQQTDVCFVVTEPYRQKHHLSAPYSALSFNAFPNALESQPHRISTPRLAPDTAIKHDSTILIMTKSYDVDPAIIDIKPYLGAQNIVVLFQNGFGSQQRACNALGDTPCFAAVTTEGANKPDHQTVIHAGHGETVIGPMNKPAQLIGKAQWFDKLAASKLTLCYDPSISIQLMRKLAINCAINPFTAIGNCRNGAVRKQRLFQEVWPQLRAELAAMLNHANLNLSESELEEIVFDVMTKTANNQSSMLQDINSARPTEIDDINGFAHRYLEQHGLPFQMNKSLTEQVHALRS